jgi:hypothetical protein
VVESGVVPSRIFLVAPKHKPGDRAERNRRVHYYVSNMGVSVSSRLKEVLLALREISSEMNDPECARVACKAYSEKQFLLAVKELLCIWIHLDALDQGGELMPAWLMNYLKLALHASDYLLPEPDSTSVMELHSDCRDLNSLCSESALKACDYLGFESYSPVLAPAIMPVLMASRSLRHKHLEDSLGLPVEQFGEMD